MAPNELPIPPHFHPEKVAEVWKVAYQDRAADAEGWAKQHDLQPASADSVRISLLLVDVQNTFCIPGFELFVGGRSGTAAVDDNRRLCEFIYRNLHVVSEICPTMDTHQAVQIFHSIFLVNDKGQHPAPFTLVSPDDIAQGVWRFNRDLASSLGISGESGQAYLEHYCRKLKEGGKYDLTIWPYHAMLGGIGHALVSAVEEAVFFHSISRYSQPDFQVKGSNPFTENYSVLSPEVLAGPGGEAIAEKNDKFIQKLCGLTQSLSPVRRKVTALPQPSMICSAKSVSLIRNSLKRSIFWKIAARPWLSPASSTTRPRQTTRFKNLLTPEYASSAPPIRLQTGPASIRAMS